MSDDTNHDDHEPQGEWERALNYEKSGRCGPWLCNLPDARTYPARQLFHCAKCGSVYRRARFSNRWVLTRRKARHQ